MQGVHISAKLTEESDPPGLEFTGGCEPPGEGVGDPLQQPYKLFTAEPSLPPQVSFP